MDGQEREHLDGATSAMEMALYYLAGVRTAFVDEFSSQLAGHQSKYVDMLLEICHAEREVTQAKTLNHMARCVGYNRKENEDA